MRNMKRGTAGRAERKHNGLASDRSTVRKTESAVVDVQEVERKKAENTEQVQAARSAGAGRPSQNCEDTKWKVQRLRDPKGEVLRENIIM